MLHLFIQPGSHQEAYYMGTPHVSGVSGNAPMTITFELSQAVPDSVFKALTLLVN